MRRSGFQVAINRLVDGAVDVDVRHIPQLVPDDLYDELVREHLPGTARDSGRLLAGLACTRLVLGTSWPEAGRRLDVDATAKTAETVEW